MFRKIEESQTLLINTQSKDLIAANKKVFKFGFGQSPFLPPKPVIEAFRNAAERKEYTSVQGDYELRKLMARFHKDHNNLNINPANILLAPGSKILILNILLAIEKADVFLSAPSWVSYAPQAKLAGHNIIKIETSIEERWRVTPHALRNAARMREHDYSVMILNYPGNPDGLSYTKTELQEIATVARQLDILVISDEIYALLDHNYSHKSFASLYPEKTITTTGMSKWCGAGGWRFGAAFLYDNIEAEFKRALIGIGSESYSCAPTPVQVAAKVAYKSFAEIEPYLNYQISILKTVGKYCSYNLNKAGIRVYNPEGGFYIFPDFSNFKKELMAAGINNSNELCERLLKETGVALLPGTAFGFEGGQLVARLAYVDFDEPGENVDFDIQVHCPRIVKGIRLVKKWVRSIE